MWLHASCYLEFNIPVDTPFLLMLRPRSGRQQWVGCEQYVLSPSVTVIEFTDPFGNLCQRLVAPAGHFSVHTSVDVECAEAFDAAPGAAFIEVQNLPDETLPFLLPSRYCESDRFTQMAASIVRSLIISAELCDTPRRLVMKLSVPARLMGGPRLSAGIWRTWVLLVVGRFQSLPVW